MFRDAHYAKQFFNLLRDWNLGDAEDRTNNIRLSFVRDGDSHFIWLYPSQDRAPVMQSLHELSQRANDGREDAEPFLITISPYYCKSFKSKGALTSFLEAVDVASPFRIVAFAPTASGEIVATPSITPIIKHHYKSRKKHELSKRDFEYAIWKKQGKL